MFDPDLSPARATDKPATVLQVVPTLESGGAERTTVDIAAHLVRAGWRAVVASEGGRMVPEIEAAGATHITLPVASKNPATMALNVSRLRRLIRETGADLVHARSRAPAWSAWAAAGREGVPFVTTYHSIYSQSSKPKAFYNSVMAKGDAVIANSHWTARLVAERHPDAAGRIVAIPRGTDLARFDPDRIDAAASRALRERWTLPADAFVFMLVARLARRKAQAETVEAFATIAADHPAAHLVMVGDDHAHDYATSLRARVTELGLTHRIHLPGHHGAPHEALALADVALMPSTVPEAFGRAAVEAGAVARPVIVTDIGATAETVIDGETGWKVPAHDVPALARAMSQAAATPPDRLADMGRAGRAHVLRDYALETMCERTLAVYRGVLGHGAQP